MTSKRRVGVCLGRTEGPTLGAACNPGERASERESAIDDFNDEALPYGTSYWARLGSQERVVAKHAGPAEAGP